MKYVPSDFATLHGLCEYDRAASMVRRFLRGGGPATPGTQPLSLLQNCPVCASTPMLVYVWGPLYCTGPCACPCTSTSWDARANTWHLSGCTASAPSTCVSSQSPGGYKENASPGCKFLLGQAWAEFRDPERPLKEKKQFPFHTPASWKSDPGHPGLQQRVKFPWGSGAVLGRYNASSAPASQQPWPQPHPKKQRLFYTHMRFSTLEYPLQGRFPWAHAHKTLVHTVTHTHSSHAHSPWCRLTTHLLACAHPTYTLIEAG